MHGFFGGAWGWVRGLWSWLFAFPPQRHFLLLGPVWISFALVFAIASKTYLGILREDELWGDFCWSSDCVNYWAHVFQVPIAMLALFVPIVAIMATHHRSAQAARQMHLVHEQNITTNYYSHLKEFKSYLSSWSSNYVTYQSDNTIYRKLYPRARDSEDGLKLDPALALRIFEGVERIERFLKGVDVAVVGPKEVEVLVREVEWFEQLAMEFEVCIDHEERNNAVFYSLLLEDVSEFPCNLESRLVDVAIFLKFMCYLVSFDPFYNDRPLRAAEDLLHSTLMIIGYDEF